MDKPQPLWTTREVAERLRVNVVTVRRWIGEGRILASRVKGRYRVTQAEVERITMGGTR